MFRRTFSSGSYCRTKELRRQPEGIAEDRSLKAHSGDVELGRRQAEGPARKERKGEDQRKRLRSDSAPVLPGNARVVDLAIAHASGSPKVMPKVEANVPMCESHTSGPVGRIRNKVCQKIVVWCAVSIPDRKSVGQRVSPVCCPQNVRKKTGQMSDTDPDFYLLVRHRCRPGSEI
jgi:hypothetical protein